MTDRPSDPVIDYALMAQRAQRAELERDALRAKVERLRAASDDKLRRLRDWIMARWPDAYTETAVDRRIVREIDRLLAEDEPEKPSETPGDELLRGWLERYEKRREYTCTSHDQDAFAERIRRALEKP